MDPFGWRSFGLNVERFGPNRARCIYSSSLNLSGDIQLDDPPPYPDDPLVSRDQMLGEESFGLAAGGKFGGILGITKGETLQKQ